MVIALSVLRNPPHSDIAQSCWSESPDHFTDLSGVHDVFHISQLKKCLRVPEEQAPLDVLDVQSSVESSQ